MILICDIDTKLLWTLSDDTSLFCSRWGPITRLTRVSSSETDRVSYFCCFHLWLLSKHKFMCPRRKFYWTGVKQLLLQYSWSCKFGQLTALCVPGSEHTESRGEMYVYDQAIPAHISVCVLIVWHTKRCQWTNVTLASNCSVSRRVWSSLWCLTLILL